MPVLAAWEDMALQAADGLHPDDKVFPRVGTARPSELVREFVRYSAGEQRPTLARLRATWIHTHLAAGTSLRALMSAAGFRSTTSLQRYLVWVPEAPLSELRLASPVEVSR